MIQESQYDEILCKISLTSTIYNKLTILRPEFIYHKSSSIFLRFLNFSYIAFCYAFIT